MREEVYAIAQDWAKAVATVPKKQAREQLLSRAAILERNLQEAGGVEQKVEEDARTRGAAVLSLQYSFKVGTATHSYFKGLPCYGESYPKLRTDVIVMTNLSAPPQRRHIKVTDHQVASLLLLVSTVMADRSKECTSHRAGLCVLRCVRSFHADRPGRIAPEASRA